MTTSKKWDSSLKRKADEFGLDPKFVRAFVQTESNGNPLVVRYEPKWKYFLTPEKYAKQHMISVETERVLQSMSWGLMQVMGTKLRELGFEGMLTEAIDPNISLHFGCKFLKHLSDKWIDPKTVAAAYNAGSPIRRADTQLFINEEYACKIMDYYQKGS